MEHYPRKLLLYFIRKHPHFADYKKNSTNQQLISIILENDIPCEFDAESYNLCTDKILREKCIELNQKRAEYGLLPKPVKSSMSKKKMIAFLLNEFPIATIHQKIKDCLRKHEDIDITTEEIEKYI